MGALIQFKFLKDGGLALDIHRSLWEQLRAAAEAIQKAEAEEAAKAAKEAAAAGAAESPTASAAPSEFVRIPLSKTTGEALPTLTGAVPGTGVSNNDPCRPVFQIQPVFQIDRA